MSASTFGRMFGGDGEGGGGGGGSGGDCGDGGGGDEVDDDSKTPDGESALDKRMSKLEKKK